MCGRFCVTHALRNTTRDKETRDSCFICHNYTIYFNFAVLQHVLI